MGKTFFVSWPLWGKMCFILLLGIVSVVILGILKVAYLHWKLRKYTRIAEAEKARKQEMEHRASVKARKARRVHVPFGVRAIESGIEVDGVWISRSNTPDTVTHGSPSIKAGSSSDRLSLQDMPQLEMPQPTRGRARLNIPKDARVEKGGASVSPERASRDRSNYRPQRSSGLRYSNAQDATMMVGQSSFQHGPSNSSSQESSDKTSPTSSTKSSEGSNNQGDYAHIEKQRQSAADILFDPAYLPPGRTRAQQIPRPSGLDSLPSSRRPQSSEASQLLPDVRLPDVGMGWTPTQPEFAESDHMLQRQFSWELSPDLEFGSDPFKTPTSSPIRSSTADEQHFTGFYQTSEPAAPVPERRIEHLGDESLPPQERQEASQTGSDQGKRASQVLRQVNSGFEILRPGTLDQQRRSIDISDAHWDEEAGQKRRSRKLQRKRAPSARSSIFQDQT